MGLSAAASSAVRRVDSTCRVLGAGSGGNSWSGVYFADFTALEGGDVFQFGVFQGGTLSLLSRIYAGYQIFGFDSFEGLPPEEDENFQVNKWHVGRFKTPIERVRQRVPNATLIAGFYNESLTPTLVSEYGMRPAAYVDIDTDLYISSKQALSWMYEQGLLVPGTIIGYDDWWTLACAANDTAVEAHGEARAHQQLARKYGARFRCVCGPCIPIPRGHAFGGRTYFALEKFGAADADAGFHMSHADCAHWMRTAKFCGLVRMSHRAIGSRDGK